MPRPLAPLLLLLHVAINQVAVPVVVAVVVVACCLRCVSGVSSCCVLCTWHVALSKLNPPPPLPPKKENFLSVLRLPSEQGKQFLRKPPLPAHAPPC